MPLIHKLTVLSVIALTACSSSGDDVNAYQHMLARDAGRACVQQGAVRDLGAAAEYIAFNERVIRSRVPAEKQASTAALIEQMRRNGGVPLPCGLFEMHAIEHATSRQPVVIQSQPAQPPRMRQTICTNIGGGMAACNTY